MAKGNFKETKLAQPLPVRLTQRQVDWLQEIKDIDGISIQDHIRRAVDAYLELATRRLRREIDEEEAAAAAGIPPNPRVGLRPRVTFR